MELTTTNVFKDEIFKEAEELAHETEELARRHYKTALRWNRANFWQRTAIAIITPILSIGTTSSIIIQYFLHTPFWIVLSFSLSLFVTILTSVVKLHNPGQRGDKHQEAGDDFASLSDNARLFYKFTIRDENKTSQDLIADLKEMVDRKNTLKKTSLALPTWVL